MSQRTDRTRPTIFPLLSSPVVLILLAGAALADGPTVDGEFLARLGIRYRLLERKEPRPLRIHALQVDLVRAEIELGTVVAADPDGDGPADAALEPPEDMACRSEAIAFINANPWQSVADAQGKRTTDWRKGLPVEILGLAVTAGAARTRMPEHGCAFWIDGKGRPRIGEPAKGELPVEAVSGFSQVLKDGFLQSLTSPDRLPILAPDRARLSAPREGRPLPDCGLEAKSKG